MLRARPISLIILFWSMSIMGCAATYNRITPSPTKNQVSFFQDGREIVVSRKPGSIVTLAPSKEAFRADERPSFVVTVNNLSTHPITFSTENLAFSIGNRQWKVFTCQELVQEIEQKKRSAATTQALIGAFGILGASMQGGKTYHSGSYQYGTTSGTYSGTSYSPLGTLQAQTTMSALTANNIANINNAASKQLNIVQNTVLKKQTVLPNTWYGGYVKIGKLKNDEIPRMIKTIVTIGNDSHCFSFKVGQTGQNSNRKRKIKGEMLRDDRRASTLESAQRKKTRKNSEESNQHLKISQNKGIYLASLKSDAQNGVPESQLKLGLMYLTGDGITQNYAMATKWMLKAAENNNAIAQLNLGLMYVNGDGVPRDYKYAAKWLQKSADQGVAVAQNNLGVMYKKGQGVKRDAVKAAHWYRRAAEQGYSVAQSNLGLMYLIGDGIAQDYGMAAKWLLKAAEQHVLTAQLNLGLMYQNGDGVPQDNLKAASWYCKAAMQGDDAAEKALSGLLETAIFPGWKRMGTYKKEGMLLLDTKRIRKEGPLVWYWQIIVDFKEFSAPAHKYHMMECVSDCERRKSGFSAYYDYDGKHHLLWSHVCDESEIDMEPIIPGSLGETIQTYVCKNRKTNRSKRTSLVFGTGWPVASGFVVTNNHVVADRTKISLIRTDGIEIPARVAMRDKTNDLALLKVKDENLLPPALALCSKPTRIGSEVITMGYPHPDIMGTKPKLTSGIISATFGAGDDPRLLQISVPLQAGNSGGPLINMNGEVVGIVMSKLNAVRMFKMTGDLPQNVNYAIKIPYLKGLLSSAAVTHKIKELKIPQGASVEEIASQITDSILLVVSSRPSSSRPSSSSSNIMNRDGVYVAYSNGIVRDTNTGLEWKVGPDRDMVWDEARSWVESLNLDGGGWRMPTVDELAGLYKKGKGGRNMTPLLKTSGWWLWSDAITIKNTGLSIVWNFNFYDGSRASYFFPGSDGNARVFAVRSSSGR